MLTVTFISVKHTKWDRDNNKDLMTTHITMKLMEISNNKIIKKK